MKLEWLETVLAVAKYGSFSEAAEEIPCAQSSVSRHVKNAEDEMGIRLFRRSSNSNVVELTDKGGEIIPLVEKLLETYRDILGRAEPREAEQIPVSLGLSFGMFSSASRAKLVSECFLAHPELVLTLRETSPENDLSLLETGKVDALLLPYPVWKGDTAAPKWMNGDMRAELLGSQRLSVALNEDDPLAARESIRLAEVKDRKFFFRTDISKEYEENRGEARAYMFVRACRESGFYPEIGKVSRHLSDVKQMLTAQGKGCYPSMIPPGLREYPGVRYVPVEDSPYRTCFYLCFPKENRGPAIRKLIEMLVNCFSESGSREADVLDRP